MTSRLRGVFVWSIVAAAALLTMPLTALAQWSSPFKGAGPDEAVRSTFVREGKSGPILYVGGLFRAIDGTVVNKIAQWNDGTWTALGTGIEIAHADVTAMTWHDGQLIAAENHVENGLSVGTVRAWNGSAWSTLGGTFAGHVGSLAVYNGELIAAGSFSAYNRAALSRIARWNGTTWLPLASGLQANSADAMMIVNTDLIVRGSFNSAGGVANTRGIARWDGNAWHQLGSIAMPVGDSVRRMTMWNGQLHVAGTIGGANRVAAFDGNALQPIGGTFNASPFYDLLPVEGELVVVGTFSSVDGAPAMRVAKWDGNAWSAVFPALTSDIGNPAVYAAETLTIGGVERLVLGGAFDSVDSVLAKNIAVRSNGTWSAASVCASCLGVSGPIRAAIVHDDGRGESLFVGGALCHAGSLRVNRIARWDGANWSSLGTGFAGNSRVYALTAFNDGAGVRPSLYAAGSFQSVDGVAASNIAKWDGAAWSPLGSGVQGSVYTMLAFDDGGGPALYAGGNITHAGGQAVGRLAKWDGENWSPVITTLTASSGSPVVHALAVWNDGNGPALIVAGNFQNIDGHAIGGLAMLRNGQWSAIGGSLGNFNAIGDVTTWNGPNGPALIVQGPFGTLGGTVMPGIALWDGSAWHDFLPAATENLEGASLTTIELSDGCNLLIAYAAEFERKLQTWNGSRWRSMDDELTGSGWSFVSSAPVVVPYMDFCTFQGEVYATGSFTASSGAPAGNIAIWEADGALECLADGNGDGFVNVTDLLDVVLHWGPCDDCSGDSAPCGGDDAINVTDLLAVISHWGPCP